MSPKKGFDIISRRLISVQSASQLKSDLACALNAADDVATRVRGAVRNLKNAVIGNVRRKSRCIVESIPQLYVFLVSLPQRSLLIF